MEEENQPYIEVTNFHKTNQPNGLWKTSYPILNLFQFSFILLFQLYQKEKECATAHESVFVCDVLISSHWI